MGRGRAKAKQQRVARELKYGGPDTDLNRLAAELSAERSTRPSFADEESDEDKYADWIDAESDEDAVEDDEDEESDERR